MRRIEGSDFVPCPECGGRTFRTAPIDGRGSIVSCAGCPHFIAGIVDSAAASFELWNTAAGQRHNLKSAAAAAAAAAAQARINAAFSEEGAEGARRRAAELLDLGKRGYAVDTEEISRLLGKAARQEAAAAELIEPCPRCGSRNIQEDENGYRYCAACKRCSVPAVEWNHAARALRATINGGGAANYSPLLPCPKCGSEAVTFRHPEPLNPPVPLYEQDVVCHSCGYSTDLIMRARGVLPWQAWNNLSSALSEENEKREAAAADLSRVANCPECGSKDIRIRRMWESDSAPFPAYAYCNDCGNGVPLSSSLLSQASFDPWLQNSVKRSMEKLYEQGLGIDRKKAFSFFTDAAAGIEKREQAEKFNREFLDRLDPCPRCCGRRLEVADLPHSLPLFLPVGRIACLDCGYYMTFDRSRDGDVPPWKLWNDEGQIYQRRHDESGN